MLDIRIIYYLYICNRITIMQTYNKRFKSSSDLIKLNYFTYQILLEIDNEIII